MIYNSLSQEFYDLKHGIHMVKIPKTGDYEFILSGWGTGNSKGCELTMVLPLNKVVIYYHFYPKLYIKSEKIYFFIGSFLGGVFLFNEDNKPLGIAGSAGER